ncbi:uracil-DNA glycosylase [Alterinioella nitratireducens]|uniref:uracil-DNA glycosylase n=1 Tax=Alterinioella nitratireducens TaxID=2735915 RepID=UPI001554EEEA|nr:uracil-DNA glycosylase [Alterinioella nitratireducens]NPD18474.1 uracil-DNA glycosylase [Alterinioella nitratireducens]
MDPATDFHALKSLLQWQVELGADEAIGEAPLNRYELPEAAPAPAPKAAPTVAAPEPREGPDPVVEARNAAARAGDLNSLRAELEGFPHCDLRMGATNLVFADGNPAARVMIVGEAPGRDEDRAGKPFVGRAGQMLDRMFDAIGLNRASPDAETALYITNILPWRPPQNRDPTLPEMNMMLPFVKCHIELVAPEIVVLMGNIPCQALIGQRGITRLRGTWTEVQGRPALPMFHPAFLLRQPLMKREAWADLLALKARLEG